MPSRSGITRSVSSDADERSSRTQVSITSDLDEGTWRDFVEAQPDANVFHTPEMFELLARADRHRSSLWAATDGSGSVLALFLPVEVSLFDGLLAAWSSRAVAYGGLLCADDPSAGRAIVPLMTAYRRAVRRRVLFTELRHLTDPAHLRPALRAAGFAHEDHLNYVVQLDQPEEDLWGALSKTARQRVRSAERKGVVVDEVTNQVDADDAYRLLEQVYRRAGVPLAGRSLFQETLSVLGPCGMFRIFVARLGEKVIGTRFLLLREDRMIDWYAGSDRAFASYSPNELLVWHTLRWGQEHGFQVFDFGGAGRPDEPYGPREFKSKFGGELVNFGRDVLVHAPLRLRMSRVAYDAAHRLLWGRALAASGERIGEREP